MSPSPFHLRHPVKAGPETPRQAAMASATVMITNLMRCVLWLMRHGIYVIGFRGWQSAGVDHIAVTVPASPHLYRLFAGQCYWRNRRQDGSLTIHTWNAERFGVRIQWEEVSCG